MADGTPYLELQAVEAWLGPRRVFDDLCLRLHLGEHTVLLGPNGSGKSALVKLLSRELYPVVKPGSWLRIFGSETVNLWELRGRIGLVSQDLQDAPLSTLFATPQRVGETYGYRQGLPAG
jgi:iron complex transport system ATP-binding protein